MLERLGSTDADIVATDYYPSVLANLKQNTARNSVSDGVRVTSKFLDWSTFCDADGTSNPIFEEGFDVVYGADIIYEALHATWIKSCLERLLCKPSTRHPDPIFHLVILYEQLMRWNLVRSKWFSGIGEKFRGNKNMYWW